MDKNQSNENNLMDAFKRTVKPEDRVFITKSSSRKEEGYIVLEIHDNGILVESDTGTEWIPTSEIHAWKKPRKEESTITGGLLTQPEDLELYFQGDPTLSLPVPNFKIQEIDSSINSHLNRWKNKYEYSISVHEPARMSQEVANIVELAETFNNSSLFYMAGFMADYSGLSKARVKEYLTKSLQIDIDNQAASVGLAALAIQEKDWRTAADFLLWSIGRTGNLNKTDLIRSLGQCILRLKNSGLPNIGQLLCFQLSTAEEQLVRRLIALVVKVDEKAFRAALSGDVDKLRATKIGNDLFPWKDDLIPPVEPINIKSKNNYSIEMNENKEREGKVSAYYPEKGFGFIVENTTGRTWFFHRTEVNSPILMDQLTKGEVGQIISFRGGKHKQTEKYPISIGIIYKSGGNKTATEVNVNVIKKAPLEVRLRSIPKDGSFFAKACEAEQLDDLENAEKYYYKEIQTKGKHQESAIKNLASLYNRKGMPEKALEILNQYQNRFEKYESLDNLRVQFYVKAKRYMDAAKILSELAKKEQLKNKMIDYLRQEAYCYFKNNDIDVAIEKLENILKKNPNDEATKRLLEKFEEAKRIGNISLFDEEEDEEEYFTNISQDLTKIALRQLEKCEFRGLDVRSIESQEFRKEDVLSVKRLLESSKGRRPRERADYLLTLAKLYLIKPELSERKTIKPLLKKHFLALAEASMFDTEPNDVVRCYATESLYYNPDKSNEHENDFNFEAAWVLLLGTYLSNRVESNLLLQPEPGKRFEAIFKRFENNKCDWDKFIDDIDFYSSKIPKALKNLKFYLEKYNFPYPLPDPSPNCHPKKLIVLQSDLPTDLSSIDKIRQFQQKLIESSKLAVFQLDRDRLLEYSKILEGLADYISFRNFRERENQYLRLRQSFKDLIDSIDRYPTHMSIEQLLPSIETLFQALTNDFSEIEKVEPELVLKNVLDNDFYTINGSILSLKLELSSKNELSPPIESLTCIPQNIDGSPCHSPEPLEGGQSRVVELIINPKDQQIADKVFTASIKVEYRSRIGKKVVTDPFKIAVRLDNQSFEEIPNPFCRYSGGLPVESKEMFFGRKDLIDRIVNLLSSGNQGQCFVLYGQKRSGKSSVMKQVELQLGNSLLYVPLSAGTFSVDNLWGSYSRLLLQEITFRLEDRNIPIPADFPNKEEMEKNPVESILKLVRVLLKMNLRLVIAIDEFTYLYECDRITLESFMKGWKALIETQTFNALLIGQDTMPRFKREFPNEFGITHDERISYLTEEESNNLASQPILLNNQSRFRGNALNRLYELTAGSPFYLQIFCDKLVRYLNSRRSAFITEADIEQVKNQLTFGDEALPIERFDGLVTAAGERTALIPKEQLWEVLTKIAKSSLKSGWCFKDMLYGVTQLDLDKILNDLNEREIIAIYKGQIKIRVGLFSEWLRTNQ